MCLHIKRPGMEVGMKKKKISGDSIQAMAMLAPMMIGFFIFAYIPIIYILRYSFYESNGIKSAWIGLENFVRIFTRDSAYFPGGSVNVYCCNPENERIDFSIYQWAAFGPDGGSHHICILILLWI